VGSGHHVHRHATGVFVPGRDHRLGNSASAVLGLSNTLTTEFCVEALHEALARFGKPGIFNTEQGAQFTSSEFTQMLPDHGIEISMDGRRRCHDNILVERLWWTVKHEWVYLRPAANGIEQKRSLAEFFDWYNLRRPHQALGGRTPAEADLGRSTAATALAA
jgi:putative transposase